MKTKDEILRTPYSFIAVAEPDDGGWTIIYPDLPGCMTQADTYDEIGPMAQDAFRVWVDAVTEDGTPVPDPRFTIDEDWDWDNWEAVRPADDAPVFTAKQVASQLEISVPRVHQLARARSLGTMRNNTRLFSRNDIAAMTVRVPGRPDGPRTAFILAVRDRYPDLHVEVVQNMGDASKGKWIVSVSGRDLPYAVERITDDPMATLPGVLDEIVQVLRNVAAGVQYA